MWSLNGLVFGIINVIGNFGTVFVDQSYWQGAIGGKAVRQLLFDRGVLRGGGVQEWCCKCLCAQCLIWISVCEMGEGCCYA